MSRVPVIYWTATSVQQRACHELSQLGISGLAAEIESDSTTGNGQLVIRAAFADDWSDPIFDVRAYVSFSLGDAKALLAESPARNQRPVLVAAPYLTGPVRRFLRERDVSFLDTTGNTFLRAQDPWLLINHDGVQADPYTPPPAQRALRGDRTGLILRAVAATQPPFTLSHIAEATGIDKGHVSRILNTLDQQGLIDRRPRGPVEDVDWKALLRARADIDRILQRRGALRCLAPMADADELLRRIEGEPEVDAVLTSSYAARSFRAITAGGFVTLYVPRLAEFTQRWNLVPADRANFDVLLIQPNDRGAVLGARRHHGLWVAEMTQIAIDCLGSVGRAVDDGEALLDWMADNQPFWRATPAEISQWTDPWTG